MTIQGYNKDVKIRIFSSRKAPVTSALSSSIYRENDDWTMPGGLDKFICKEGYHEQFCRKIMYCRSSNV